MLASAEYFGDAALVVLMKMRHWKRQLKAKKPVMRMLVAMMATQQLKKAAIPLRNSPPATRKARGNYAFA